MASPDTEPITRARPGAPGSWTIMSRPLCRASWGLEASGGGAPSFAMPLVFQELAPPPRA